MRPLCVLESLYRALPLFVSQESRSQGEINMDSGPVSLPGLEHWGHYASATYHRFEDWQNCVPCQHEDVRDVVLNTTWSTVLPAFSRGYIGVHHERQEIVVAYRGTTHVMDVLTDSQITGARWPDGVDGSRVHSGFLLAYLSSRRTVQGALEALAIDPKYASYTLHFVGHSLGGGQATLSYMDYLRAQHVRANGEGGKRQQPLLVSFGAPRVGNGIFAQHLNALSSIRTRQDTMLRVVHENDIVPHLPISMLVSGEYAHSDRELWVRDLPSNDADSGDQSDGQQLITCDISDSYGEDQKCSVSVSPLLWSLKDHMVYPGIQIGIPRYFV